MRAPDFPIHLSFYYDLPSDRHIIKFCAHPPQDRRSFHCQHAAGPAISIAGVGLTAPLPPLGTDYLARLLQG